ncbi:hypothetical protein [Mammaliicoccus lentus]|uniref:hypothetical protein n=1 Tax=Mammaliicoccus lentus TaxID=42858 RepID=UPI00107289BD|nr:hypothetical protein [Mammaliicoccus lentus]MBF0795214.1 hypothetical protein [Mammaliicoccus lentus]TFV14611.1 hypothetical protein E4T78_11140 [Mammaliicoccus lentus]
MFNLPNLQKEFNNAEEGIRERLEGLPIFGYYKKVVSEIMNIDETAFEMLYDDDIENRKEYDIETEDLHEAFERLKEINEAG